MMAVHPLQPFQKESLVSFSNERKGDIELIPLYNEGETVSLSLDLMNKRTGLVTVELSGHSVDPHVSFNLVQTGIVEG